MGRMARTALVRLAVGAAVVAGTLGGVAAPAWAPKYILGSFAFGECELAEPASFDGDFTVLSFHASGGQLYATASLTGTCVDGVEVVATVPPGVYEFPVALTTVCEPADAVLEIRPGAALVGGILGPDPKTGEPEKVVVDLSRGTVVDRIWMTGDPRSEGARLCAVDRAVDRGASASQVATLLNQLVLRV